MSRLVHDRYKNMIFDTTVKLKKAQDKVLQLEAQIAELNEEKQTLAPIVEQATDFDVE